MNRLIARRRLLQAMSLSPLGVLPPAWAGEAWHMPDEGEPHAATWMSFGPKRGRMGSPPATSRAREPRQHCTHHRCL